MSVPGPKRTYWGRGLLVVLVGVPAFLMVLGVVGLLLPESGVREVSAMDFEPWPLVPMSGTLRCRLQAGRPVVTIEADGREWGVNGGALAFGYPRLDPIWRHDPRPYRDRISVTELLDAGLDLCG